MKIQTVVLVLLGLFAIANDGGSQPALSDAAKKEMEEILTLSIDNLVRRGRSLSPPLKMEVIRALKERAAQQPPDLREQYYRIMFDLGDEATVERYGKEFVAGDLSNSGGFTSSQNPRVIELIVPVIFRDEGELVPGENRLSLSINTSLAILEILQTTPDFNSDVSDWARRLPPQRRSWYELRDVMREWWRENEPFFKAGDYQAVKPGPSVEKEPTRAAAPAQEVPTATSASPATATPAATLAKAPELASEKQITPWLWIVVILTLVLVVALVFKRRA